MTDDEIRAECIRRDAIKGHIVYLIDRERGTFKLVVASIRWRSMSEAERWCMVKYGNIFDTPSEVHAAIWRAMQK